MHEFTGVFYDIDPMANTMSAIWKINLSYENRVHLNKDSGSLIHVSGEGYFIVDEYGREVNTFIRFKKRIVKGLNDCICGRFKRMPNSDGSQK